METRTEKEMPVSSAHSPQKGYIGLNPVQSVPPPPPYALHPSTHPSTQSASGYAPISGLISPPASHSTESRRPSDDEHHHASHRQSLPSLPSLSEAVGYGAPRPAASGPPPPPTSYAPSHSYAASSSYPHPPPPPPARPYPYDERPPYPPSHGHSIRRSPPPTLYAPNHYAPPPERSQPLPSLRTALPSQAAPYSPHHHPEPSRYEADPRRMEPPREERSRSYGDPYYGYPTSGNNGYPAPYQPRARSPVYPSAAPYSRPEPSRPYPREEMGRPMGIKRDFDHSEPEPMMFQRQLEHNLGNHDFEMALMELQQCGKAVTDISEELLESVRRSQRDQDSHGIPAMRYHDQMLGCQRKLDDAFSNVKHFMAQQQQLLDDAKHHHFKARDGKPGYHDDEHWQQDKDQFNNGPDQKKIRRGRAAPPGRCHSCNRAETPEWRRGPDGARTLCNACGLHYAKLTRRMGSKQNAQSAPGSALRPKSIDGSPL